MPNSVTVLSSRLAGRARAGLERWIFEFVLDRGTGQGSGSKEAPHTPKAAVFQLTSPSLIIINSPSPGRLSARGAFV